MLENLIKIKGKLINLSVTESEYIRAINHLIELASLADVSREFEIYLKMENIIDNLMDNDKNGFYDEIILDNDYNIDEAYRELEEALENAIKENEDNASFYREQLELLRNI